MSSISSMSLGKYLPWILGAIVVLVIVIAVVATKKHIGEGWGEHQIGMGASPADISPGDGFVPSYLAKTTGSRDQAENLLGKWFIFESKLTPDVSGSIYALFPDLQTPQSIQYYGLSDGMMRVLKAISGKLNNPESIKSLEDVNRIFSPTAIKIFSQDVDIRPTDSLYNNPKEYGWYEDVA